MRKALLLYNPRSGRSDGHLEAVQGAEAVLRQAGIETLIAATLSSPEAARQAKEALAQGYDTIFACGGDGTIQDVAQGLVGESAALALIPLGTANVLANDLGIPNGPAEAAQAALAAVTVRVSVGHVACRSVEGAPVSRHFLSVAGAGLDGHLFHKLDESGKRTLGLAAYFLKAFQIWWSYPMQWFSAAVSTDSEDAEMHEQVTQLLAVRVRDFGNVLRELAPGASLLRNDFRVVLFKTSSRWGFLFYVLRGVLGVGWEAPRIELSSTTRLRCEAPASGNPVYIEADGELLGKLPAEITIIPAALTLLVPRSFASRQP